MRKLGCWPPAVVAFLTADAAEAGRKFDPSKLRSSGRYAADNVISILRRKAGIANLVGNTETTKYFHRTRRHLIALDVRRFASHPSFQDGYVDVSRSEVHRKRQPHGTRTHHDYTGIDGSIHFPAEKISKQFEKRRTILGACGSCQQWVMTAILGSVGELVVVVREFEHQCSGFKVFYFDGQNAPFRRTDCGFQLS